MTDENRSLKDKIRDFLEEKGVYVVLLSSVAIVGVAAPIGQSSSLSPP